ncbi:MAG: HAD family phosphatase [Candidatus Cloacimonetes bacterium]|nr:HAD family phosphatase [Candidatus Cloacimonadota bacterium]
MKNIKAVIFDMDGVIIDSEPIYFQIQKKVFDKLGFYVSDEEYNTFIGLGVRTMWERLKSFRILSQSIEELIKLNNKMILDFFKEYQEIQTIPYFRKFLNSVLKEGMKVAVASSTSKATIKVILEKLNLLKPFDVIISGEEVKNGKPAPDIFLETARRLKLPSESCIVIEDSANGVIAAKNAKMKCIGFSNPNSGSQNLSKADRVIKCFSEINISDLKLL